MQTAVIMIVIVQNAGESMFCVYSVDVTICDLTEHCSVLPSP